MEKMKTTTLTTMLKTLTVAIALTIASQAQAQHTQGPTVEGVALPNLGGGEEGEITEEQVIEVQRQCNENLVKEYLYTGSGGKVSLEDKLESESLARANYTSKYSSEHMSYISVLSSGNSIYLFQHNYKGGQVPAVTLLPASLKIVENFKSSISVNLSIYNLPAFVLNLESKFNVNGIGQIVNKREVVNQLEIVKSDDVNIEFMFSKDGTIKTIFSYPTAKYVSCLKAGVASLAK